MRKRILAILDAIWPIALLVLIWLAFGAFPFGE
jgi:hypothetical protein